MLHLSHLTSSSSEHTSESTSEPPSEFASESPDKLLIWTHIWKHIWKPIWGCIRVTWQAPETPRKNLWFQMVVQMHLKVVWSCIWMISNSGGSSLSPLTYLCKLVNAKRRVQNDKFRLMSVNRSLQTNECIMTRAKRRVKSDCHVKHDACKRTSAERRVQTNECKLESTNFQVSARVN